VRAVCNSPDVHLRWLAYRAHVPKDDQTKLISEACGLLGPKKVAEGLGVSTDVVQSWLDGSADITHSKLQKLSQLLVNYANKK
jgi:hypothetical protein